MLYEKDFKSPTALKNHVRESVFSDMLEMFAVKYGADRVTIVDKSEIAVGVNDIETKDGASYEIVITVKPVVKDYEDRKTATKTINRFDRLDEGEIYKAKKTEKEKQAEEKARLKAEKIERDKKARAKKKAEKEKAEKEGE